VGRSTHLGCRYLLQGPKRFIWVFIYKVSILKPDSPSDAVVVDSCNHIDHVCHSREDAPHYFFLVFNTFFLIIYTLPCRLMISRWGSFGFSTLRRSNYIPILGRLFKRLESSVIFLSYNPLLNFFYFIITPVSVLHWVGSLWKVDQGVFALHLKLRRINTSKKNTSKILWSRMANPFFMTQKGKRNFLFIGPNPRWDMSP